MNIIQNLKIEFYKTKNVKFLIISILFPLLYWVLLTLYVYNSKNAIVYTIEAKNGFDLLITHFAIFFGFINLFVSLYLIVDMVDIELDNNYKKQLDIFGVNTDNMLLNKLVIIMAYTLISIATFLIAFYISYLVMDSEFKLGFEFGSDFWKITKIILSYPILQLSYYYLLINIFYKYEVKNTFLNIILPIIFQISIPIIAISDSMKYIVYLPNYLLAQDLFSFPPDSPSFIQSYRFHLLSITYFIIFYIIFNFKRIIIEKDKTN